MNNNMPDPFDKDLPDFIKQYNNPMPIEKIDKFGRNSTKLKKLRAEHKQFTKNQDRDSHIEMSNAGLPRRNKVGNKLGLRKRRLLYENTL